MRTGFTILETLAAIILMGMLMVTLSHGLHMAADSLAPMPADQQGRQHAEALLTRLHDDIHTFDHDTPGRRSRTHATPRVRLVGQDLTILTRRPGLGPVTVTYRPHHERDTLAILIDGTIIEVITGLSNWLIDIADDRQAIDVAFTLLNHDAFRRIAMP